MEYISEQESIDKYVFFKKEKRRKKKRKKDLREKSRNEQRLPNEKTKEKPNPFYDRELGFIFAKVIAFNCLLVQ